jgi:long-chain acyl-CoA synthetase
MLSHANFLENAHAGLLRVPVYTNDIFLSILPLSHSLERTAGYYAPMMAGACVAHIRSMKTLAEDLRAVRPTVLVTVPRIFERFHLRIMERLAESRLTRPLFWLTVHAGWERFLRRQGRDRWSPLFLLWPLLKGTVATRITHLFGGRVRVAISGGAPLSPAVARVFLGLGLNLLQGYGLTEASPVVSANTEDDNLPATVGRSLPGVEVRTSEAGELLVRGPNVMLGYWRNDEATEAAVGRDGWLHTGDTARIDGEGHITITGRIKEIIVLSTGEKVPPDDVGLAILGDPLIEQVLVVGEERPYLAALVVLNEKEWGRLAGRLGIDPRDDQQLAGERVEKAVLERIDRRLKRFPGYAKVRRVHLTLSPWTITDGLVTATLKLRRREIVARFAREVEALYAGH